MSIFNFNKLHRKAGGPSINLEQPHASSRDNKKDEERLNSQVQHYCTICCNIVPAFNPGGIPSELFERHHVIGGGPRENSACPICGALDRSRWTLFVLEKVIDLFNSSGRVLHFAPFGGESVIRERLQSNPALDYYPCDIAPGRDVHIIDITDIPFKDNTFDYVISNHVMEHIPDEAKAVGEVMRILKPTGKWLLSFPICTDQDTFEDENIIDVNDRLRVFGQEDHVRLYGRNYRERFEKYGIKLNTFSPNEMLSEEEISRLGLIKDDVAIIASHI